LVLLGLALLHQNAQLKEKDSVEEGRETNSADKVENGNCIENKIEYFSRGIAPVLLPIVDSLGALDLENMPTSNSAGEAT